MLFENFYEQLLLKVFMINTPCDCVYHGDFYLSCMCNTESSPHPHPLSPTTTIKVTCDWLGDGFDLRGFCYWNLTQTGNLNIDMWPAQ
jgi:hypothetical protein